MFRIDDGHRRVSRGHRIADHDAIVSSLNSRPAPSFDHLDTDCQIVHPSAYHGYA